MGKHFTPAQRALLRTELEQRKVQLTDQLRTHQEGRTRAEHARDVLERDYDDAPQRAMEREVDMALTDIDTFELERIERALRRIEEDEDFGNCADCGADIPFDRLRIEPYAIRCVACESQREQQVQKRF